MIGFFFFFFAFMPLSDVVAGERQELRTDREGMICSKGPLGGIELGTPDYSLWIWGAHSTQWAIWWYDGVSLMLLFWRIVPSFGLLHTLMCTLSVRLHSTMVSGKTDTKQYILITIHQLIHWPLWDSPQCSKFLCSQFENLWKENGKTKTGKVIMYSQPKVILHALLCQTKTQEWIKLTVTLKGENNDWLAIQVKRQSS